MGTTNRIADEGILAELERRHRNVSLDSLVVYDVPLKECDLEQFREFYFEKAGKHIGDEQLISLELVKTEREEKLLTNTAILIASNLIKKQIFPYAKIECARFKGQSTSVMIDQQTIDAAIFGDPSNRSTGKQGW